MYACVCVCSPFTLEGNDHTIVVITDKQVSWLMMNSTTMGYKYSISIESLGTLQYCFLDNAYVTRGLNKVKNHML